MIREHLGFGWTDVAQNLARDQQPGRSVNHPNLYKIYFFFHFSGFRISSSGDSQMCSIDGWNMQAPRSPC